MPWTLSLASSTVYAGVDVAIYKPELASGENPHGSVFAHLEGPAESGRSYEEERYALHQDMHNRLKRAREESKEEPAGDEAA